jgi:hypothetical protein
MIEIKKSSTADTRTCDYKNVTKATLHESSIQHIDDVRQGLAFFIDYMCKAAVVHDKDKLTEIDWFHRDFITGFKETGWWDRHRKINRHHLAQEDGVPLDVNLLDILEYIVDGIMAGKARGGEVYDPIMTDELLMRAFSNTVAMLKEQVVVVEDPVTTQ